MTSIFGNDFDRKMMGKALARARAASKAGEVPIGALVVNAHGLIIGSGYNQVEKYQSQAKHAEMIALTKAARTQGDWRLEGCWLYVSLEPCLMCMGMIKLSRIAGIVFGAASPVFGFRLDKNVTYQVYQDDTIKVIEGIEAKESMNMLQQFFQEKRKTSG